MALLRVVVAAGVAALAVRMVTSWRTARDRVHAALATGVCLLGAAAIGSRIALLAPSAETVLGDVSLICFAASGIALLAVRDTMFPLPRRTWFGAVAGITAVTTAAVIARTGRDAESFPAVLGGSAVAALWIATLVGSAVRFWQAGAGRPSVQRFRLRGLAFGYVTVMALTIASVVATLVEGSDGAAIAVESMLLLSLPPTYIALAAPQWARRWWREPEERAVSRALQELVTAEVPTVVADRAVEWARRLVGAHAAVIVDVDGTVLATSGPDAPDLVQLAEYVAAGQMETGPVQLAGVEPRWAIAVPLTGSGGALGVVSDPIAPLFGREELDALAAYAASVATALERVSLLERVERQSDRYQNLLQAIGELGVGFVIIDRATDRLVFANQAFADLTGYPREALLELPSFEPLLDAADAIAIAAAMDGAARGEIISDAYETVAVRADGSLVGIEVAAKVTEDGGYVVALVRDVSERRRLAALEQRRFEQLSRLAVAAGELAARSLDVEELVSAATEAACTILDCEWAEVVLSHGDGDAVRRGTTGQPTDETGETFSVPLVRGHETLGTLSIGRRMPSRSSAVGGAAGGNGTGGFDEIDAAVAASFAAYLSEAIAVAQAFAREGSLVAELQDMHRMKDTLLSAVSHELRGPLTVMLGLATTLERSRSHLAEEELDNLLHSIGRNARKVDRLVGDLLDMDRLQRGILEPRRTPTDIAALVREVVDEIGLAEEREVNFDMPSLVAAVDAPKVERIIENLLTNADRHTPPATPVWISVRPESDGVLVIVEDGGPGVPEHAREVIFEPFRRGDDVYAQGLGIGLSLVARFAELHGGRAWVTDRDGGGASFRVHLPADLSMAETSAPAG